MKVDPNISDLFFNQDFSDCENRPKVKGQFNGYNLRRLLEKATNVLDNLRGLGLRSTPNRKEVVRDFLRRV